MSAGDSFTSSGESQIPPVEKEFPGAYSRSRSGSDKPGWRLVNDNWPNHFTPTVYDTMGGFALTAQGTLLGLSLLFSNDLRFPEKWVISPCNSYFTIKSRFPIIYRDFHEYYWDFHKLIAVSVKKREFPQKHATFPGWCDRPRKSWWSAKNNQFPICSRGKIIKDVTVCDENDIGQMYFAVFPFWSFAEHPHFRGRSDHPWKVASFCGNGRVFVETALNLWKTQ